jgi:ADP-ribose pyrophosphatase
VGVNREENEKEILARGRHIQMVRAEGWEYVERRQVVGVVVVVAVTKDGKLLLTDQYRAPVRRHVIELPAGLVEATGELEQEDLITAARRELLEETGYEADGMTLLTEGPPSAGLSAEIVTFFRAIGLEKTGQGGGVGDERIVVHEVPLPEVDGWLRHIAEKGVLIDPKVYTGLFFALQAH